MLQVVFLACAVQVVPICITAKVDQIMTPAMCEQMKTTIARKWMESPAHPFTKFHSDAVFCERGFIDV